MDYKEDGRSRKNNDLFWATKNLVGIGLKLQRW